MNIQIRFINSGSLVAKAITWETFGAGGEWSHVEFCLPNGYLGSQAPEGVLLRPLNYTEVSSQLVCNIQVTDDIGNRVLNFAQAQICKPYDYESIVGFVFKGDMEEPGAWFCSEFVAYSFMQAGFPLLRTSECNRISPSTLSLSPYLVPVGS